MFFPFLLLIYIKIQNNFNHNLLNSEPLHYSEKDRVPFKVKLGLVENDDQECKNIGQIIKWGTYNNVCTSQDIITEELRNNFKSVLTNMELFLNKLIKINRNTQNIKIEGYPLWNISKPLNNEIETDLYIHILIRMSNNTDAPAVNKILQYSSIDNRPYEGLIIWNPRFIPKIIEDETSIRGYYFNLLFHEIVHDMGFHSSFFKNWLNRETGLSWGDSFPIKKSTHPLYPNKTFNIISTPQCRKFIERRFNLSTFDNNIPIGVEVEDFPSETVRTHHLESRLYINEVMVARPTTFPLIISDLTLSIIEDMGWYSCNFSYGKKLPWGDGKSRNSTFMKDFPLKPPQYYPNDYICQNDEFDAEYTCSYDYASISKCSKQIFSCPNSLYQDFCDSQEFYNPKNLTYMGKYPLVDFIPIKVSDQFSMCIDDSNLNQFKLNNNLNMEMSKNSQCIRINKFGLKSAACYKTQCNSENNILSIFINNDIYNCNYENQIININNTNFNEIICPNPLIICNTKSLYNEKLTNPERIPLYGDKIFPTKSPTSSINPGQGFSVLELTTTISALLLIFGISLYICFYREADDKTSFMHPLV